MPSDSLLAINNHRLELKRLFKATPEAVFDAWITPGAMLKWFKGEKTWSVPVALADLRVGGKYRIDMRIDSGIIHSHFGKYIEIDRPRRLVFTWNSEWSDGETLVTIELKPDDVGTELTLVHERFSTIEARNDHGEGWPACLDSLDIFLKNGIAGEVDIVTPKPGSFARDTGLICWRAHFSSPPEKVFNALASDEGRKSHWAESAVENNGYIHFEFLNDISEKSRVIIKNFPTEFAIEYFGSKAVFVLKNDKNGGTDLVVTAHGVNGEYYPDFYAGWVSWLMTLKGAVDFGIDLRNHDENRTWFQGYADN